MTTYNCFRVIYRYEGDIYRCWLKDEINGFRNKLVDDYGHFSEIVFIRVLRDKKLIKHVMHAEIHITDKRTWHLMTLKNDMVCRVIKRISRRFDQIIADNQDGLVEVSATDLLHEGSK